MKIPYPYNRTGAGPETASGGPVPGERGVFTWLRNGGMYQRGMTLDGVFLDSAKVRSMAVLSDGTALHTTAHYGGTQTVLSGGLADGVVVNSGGRMVVSSGGTARDVSINYNGYASAYGEGAVISGGEINSSGTIQLLSGAQASGITVSAYGNLYGESSNRFADCVLASGGRFSPGNSATVEHLTVCSNATFSCVQRMSARNISVQSGGYLYISSGAKCLDAEVALGGRIFPYVTGHDEETVLTGSGPKGAFSVSGGVASNFILEGGASLPLYYYGSAMDTTLSSGGSLYVSFGAVAERNTVCQYGRVIVYSGGTALNTEIQSGGSCFADFRGEFRDTTVSSGGQLYVYNHGACSRTDILHGGYMQASSGGRIVSATVAGSAIASSGAALSALDIQSGGAVSARRGCTASDITVESGGLLWLNDYTDGGCIHVAGGSAWLLNMGSFSGVSLGEGAICSASAYITMSGVSVAEGASLFLSAYTTARDVSVASGGTLWLGSGGSALGVTAAEGAVVSVADGGFVEYAE